LHLRPTPLLATNHSPATTKHTLAELSYRSLPQWLYEEAMMSLCEINQKPVPRENWKNSVRSYSLSLRGVAMLNVSGPNPVIQVRPKPADTDSLDRSTS